MELHNQMIFEWQNIMIIRQLIATARQEVITFNMHSNITYVKVQHLGY